jgi:enoyl-CoA hydratase/carnithine racemase
VEVHAEASTDVNTERIDNVLIVTLHRPAVRNALRTRTWHELDAALDDAESDGSIGVLVLSGGGRWFSSGADLAEASVSARKNPADLLARTARLRLAGRVIGRLRHFPKPTIASVEGYAIGLAWPLVLSCDLVVSSRSAYFGAPPQMTGMLADGGLTGLLIDAIGRRRAAEILLSKDQLSAEEAQRYGDITVLSEPGGALQAARELAAQINRRPLEIQILTKGLLVSAAAGEREAQLGHEWTAVALNRLQLNNRIS